MNQIGPSSSIVEVAKGELELSRPATSQPTASTLLILLRHTRDVREAAVSSLRAIRPGSIETDRQKIFVSKWCSTIWKRQSVLPDLPSEPLPCDLEVEGTLDDTNDLFLLVGLPGSGKCNPDAGDRKTWLALASSWARSPVCVWFDYDHDSVRLVLNPDQTSDIAARQQSTECDRTNAQDACTSFAQRGIQSHRYRSLLRGSRSVSPSLIPPITIVKFLVHLIYGTSEPRRTMMFTSMWQRFQWPRRHVIITEKIDGANMGFSLPRMAPRSLSRIAPTTSIPRPTNSSRNWALGRKARRRSSPYFGAGRCFPERFILFGEWMYATHSIPYTDLPDRFVAFDLYDRSTGSFADSKYLASLLSETSCHCAYSPRREYALTTELRDMVQKPSMFYMVVSKASM
ncbi:ATP dependent DNA ligase [Salix suchowensis]|nr:ATP dependent DNA ligase [Salix suchowensis]